MAILLDERWAEELWASPYRLRFELNAGQPLDGDSYVGMFTSSYDRARELARAALTTRTPHGIVSAWANASWILAAMNGREATMSGFDMLARMGVPTDPAEAIWQGHVYRGDAEDDEMAPCEHRAVRLTWDQADILLWNNIAQEIGVEPKAPVCSTLIDLEQGVSVVAYDDRGVDITALEFASIEPLYRRYDAWLLDRDRPRMAEVFGPRIEGG